MVPLPYVSFQILKHLVSRNSRAGEELTFADIVLAPFAARLYVLREHRALEDSLLNDKFKSMPGDSTRYLKSWCDWSTDAPCVCVCIGLYAEWRETILKRESVASTLSEEKYYEEIYGRYLRDEAQSEMAKATRGGRVSLDSSARRNTMIPVGLMALTLVGLVYPCNS